MLDPRTKLSCAFVYGLLVILTGKTVWLAGEGAILLTLILIGRMSRPFLGWLRMLLPMAVFFGLVMALSFSVADGINAGLRLMVLAGVFFVFFETTRPEDLGNALVQSGLPFSVAFVMTASLQFVPVVSRKARAVMDAQRSRGISLKPGLDALRRWPRFLLPVLVQAFQLAEELAEAMEVRGFGRKPRTALYRFRFRALDGVAFAGLTTIAVVCLRLMKG